MLNVPSLTELDLDDIIVRLDADKKHIKKLHEAIVLLDALTAVDFDQVKNAVWEESRGVQENIVITCRQICEADISASDKVHLLYRATR